MKRGEYPLHNIEAAMSELKANIKGFIVEMPLDWGVRERVTPKAPPGGGQTIAELNDSKVVERG